MHLPISRRIRLAAIVVPCLTGVLAAQAPGQRPRDPAAQAQAGRGLIAGALVAMDSGRPVRQARVTLSGGDSRVVKTAVTDDQGRFEFADLPPGQFTLAASKSGFLDVTYGQKRPGSGRPGTLITLAAGQRLERVALPITRGGVITGTVFDEVGDVSYGTPVQAMRYVMRNGVRTLQMTRATTTDDRGIYRLPILMPGEYVIVAMPRDVNMAGLDAMKMRVELVMVEASKMSAYVVEHGAVDAQRLRARAGEVEEPANGYTTTFYPSSLLASGATNVTIEAAEERTGVDVRLQLVPLATITGTVTADGPVPPGVQVSVFDAAETMVGLGTRTTRVGPNGQFSFSGLPPGTYTVLARGSAPVEHSVTGQPVGSTSAEKVVIFARGSAGESLWAMTSAAVSGGTVPVSLNLQRGMTVSGSVAFSGPTSAPPDVSKLRVTVAPVGESGKVEGLAVRDVPVTADGQFTIRGVIPGLYRVVPSSGVPPGFLIESAMFGGRDVLDIPLDVKPGEDVAGGVLTFSTQQSELSGALTDPAGKPATDYTLILFAADNRFWLPQSRRIQAARPASDGRFSFRYLPAGDYRLIAVEDVEQGQWFDPGFLKQLLAGAMPLSLAAAEKRTQDIRVSR